GLLSSPLTDLELGSVVMHEVHHHRMRDPLKGFILSILTHLFFYIPVIRSYAEFWQQHREWEADAAAKRVSDATSLAEALCKLLSKSPHVSGDAGFAITSRQAAAAPALHGMGNVRERIELLLELRQPRTWHLSARELAASVTSLVLLALLTLGLISPVDMSPGLGGSARIADGYGWVLPQRMDPFWVPPFQGQVKRVRFVGQETGTIPPPSRHRVTP
ncbi:MAG TPA: M56 family metallopeptidase, partial [bacterium]|nr:M56 family metallopeptidase [bacterium]